MNTANYLLIVTLLLILTTNTHATTIADQVPSPTYATTNGDIFDLFKIGSCIGITDAAADVSAYGIDQNDPLYKSVNGDLDSAKDYLSKATLRNPALETTIASLVGTSGVLGLGYFLDFEVDWLKFKIKKNTELELYNQYTSCSKNAFTAMDYIVNAFNKVASATDEEAVLLQNKLGESKEFTSESNALVEYELAVNGNSQVNVAINGLKNNFAAVFDDNKFTPNNANKIVFAVQSAARKDGNSQLSDLIKLYTTLRSANAHLISINEEAKVEFEKAANEYDRADDQITTQGIDVDIFEVRKILESSSSQVELSIANGSGWYEKKRNSKLNANQAEKLKILADDTEKNEAPGSFTNAIQYRKEAVRLMNEAANNLQTIIDESIDAENDLESLYTRNHNEADTLLDTSGDFAGKYKLITDIDNQNIENDGQYKTRIKALIKGIKTSDKVIALLGNGESKAKAVNAVLKEVNDGISLAAKLEKQDVIVAVEKQDLVNIKAQLENGTYSITSVDVQSRIDSMIISANEKYSSINDYYQEALELREISALKQADISKLDKFDQYFDSNNLLNVRSAADQLSKLESDLSEMVIKNQANWETNGRTYVEGNLKVYAQPVSLRIGEDTQVNSRISLTPPRPLASNVELPLEKISLFSNAQVKNLQVVSAHGITLNDDSLTFTQGADYYLLEFTYSGVLSDFTSFTKTAVITNNYDYADVTITSKVNSKYKYQAVWSKPFEAGTRNIVINSGAQSMPTAPSELNLSLNAGDNSVKIKYVVVSPIDWQVTETPNGKHYKLTPALDLDSASFVRVETSECDLQKAQITGGSEVTSKVSGASAFVTFSFKNLKAGDERNYDLTVSCKDNSTTKLTESKSGSTITSVENNALQREREKSDTFDFNELTSKLTSVQTAYDNAFFTTDKSPKKYISKMQADKLLSTGSKALTKLEKQKDKPELLQTNMQLNVQILDAISKANEAISDVKNDAYSTLEDAKNRQSQFGTSDSDAILSKAISLYSKGQYMESMSLATQVTKLLPEAMQGSESPITGNVTGGSTKDLTLYASIAVILLAIGYLAFNKKKEEPKTLTIIPSNNV